MTEEMFKFVPSEECEFATDEALKEALNSETSTQRRFDPGKYEVEIASIELHKARARNDEKWATFKLTLEGVGQRSIDTFINVPTTNHLRYGPKNSLMPYKSLDSFCEALGVKLTNDNRADFLNLLFGNAKTLQGKKVAIEVGYRKGYVKYVGKTAEGANQYLLVTQDGNSVCDMNGQPIVFPDFAAARSYAEEKGVAIDNISVTKYSPAASGSGLTIGKVANW